MGPAPFVVAVAPYHAIPRWLAQRCQGWGGIPPGVPRRCLVAAYCSLMLRVGIALLVALWLAGR